MKQAARHLLECPVHECFEVFGPNQPMLLRDCGHHISRRALEEALSGNATCPVCDRELDSRDISDYRRSIGITSLLELREDRALVERFALQASRIRVDHGAEIGRGSSGIVHRGTLAGYPLSERVAVKQLKVQNDSAEFREHVARELEVMCLASERLSGHVMGVRGFSFQDSAVMLVLELSQHSLLTEFESESSGEVPRIGEQRWVELAVLLAEALKALHELGIVHGAVSPANVLLSRSGHYKLADFGLTLMVNAMPGFACGPSHAANCPYAAPETYRSNERATEKADVWSLAAVLYFLWCGEPPFGRASVIELVNLHNEREQPELDSVRMPQSLRILFKQCFRYDATGRPSTSALCARLRRMQDVFDDPVAPVLTPAGAFEVFVRTPTGKMLTISDLWCSSTVDELIRIVQDKEGIPPEHQRFIYAGKQLEEGRTFGDYNIPDQSTLHMVLKLRGNIGVWATPDSAVVGESYLQGHTAACLAPGADVLQIILASMGPCTGSRTVSPRADVQIASRVLPSEACAALTAFTERCFQAQQAVLPPEDALDNASNFRMEVSEADLVGVVDHELVSALSSLLGKGDRSVRYFLRRVGAISGRGVRGSQSKQPRLNFHRDDAVATASIALNDGSEYDGAQLMFAFDDGTFFCPPRPLGAAVIHSGRVVHGVTCMHSGVRYNLFLQKGSSRSVAGVA